MSGDQLGGIFRAMIPTIAAFLGAYFLDGASWTIILGALGTIISAIWSFANKTPAKTLNSAASVLPPGATLLMIPSANASSDDKAKLAELGRITNDRVSAKV
jgi:hypothetical protein